MSTLGPFVHRIDPIIATVFGVHLWWYGASYTLGFLNAHLHLRRRRRELGFSPRMVHDLTLLLAAGVLVGGRAVEVAFYEWPFYREHPALIPAYWIGGMATHGLLLGGLCGIAAFSRLHRVPFLWTCDALAVPAAVIMGFGRIGNFIDGQIVGSVTDVWWAVQFPDAEGFRHPVVLYDGLKNLAIAPILVWITRRKPPRGVAIGAFLFLYAFLRIFVDLYREYPTSLLGLATGQVLNIATSAIGFALIVWPLWRKSPPEDVGPVRAVESEGEPARSGWRPIGLTVVLLVSLVMPSDWTQDVPERYGKRHPGLSHSALYPPIERPR